MKYPKEYLEEIKLRMKVSQVVGKSVKLKKRGKEFIGLSPFSNPNSRNNFRWDLKKGDNPDNCDNLRITKIE